MNATEKSIKRVDAFEKLYDVFYEYFTTNLSKDATKYNIYRLQLASVFFDDLELYNKITPVFQSFSSTLAEKQAVARAALYNALVANSFGVHQDKVMEYLSNRVADLEDNRADVKNKLAAIVGVLDIWSLRITAIENELKSQSNKLTEPKSNAIPKRKYTRKGKEEGSQEQTNDLGS